MNQFKSEELRIIDENSFNKLRHYLNNQLDNIDNDKENFQSLDDLNESLEIYTNNTLKIIQEFGKK